MSCFCSKHKLLELANHAITHYYQRVPFVRNHPQAIDLDMLVMELMGGSSNSTEQF
jgi:7,8-dihydro-6-hydroxymethylpterin-pyrophosphokinase